MTKMTKTEGICHLQNKNSKFKTKIQITKITKNRENVILRISKDAG